MKSLNDESKMSKSYKRVRKPYLDREIQYQSTFYSNLVFNIENIFE